MSRLRMNWSIFFLPVEPHGKGSLVDGRLHCVFELLSVDEGTGCVEHLDLSAQDPERCIRTLFYISVSMNTRV